MSRYAIEVYDAVTERWHLSVDFRSKQAALDEFKELCETGDASLRIFDTEAPGGELCVIAERL